MISPGHKRSLNRALHELRRPLQALTLMEDGLAGTAASPPRQARRGMLELAASALAELDRAVNGGDPAPAEREISCRELIVATVERWRPTTRGAGGIRLFWDAGPAVVRADPIGIARALDNLIANALEHGGPPLVITGAAIAGKARITIANGRAGPAARVESTGNGDAPPGDGRRGHGVEIVSRIVEEHGGRFARCESGSGCVAVLELPLAEAGRARAV